MHCYIKRGRYLNICCPLAQQICSSKAEYKCQCGNEENMEHVYSCTILNSEKTDIHYEKIYSENIHQIREVHRRFQKNLKRRERLLNEIEEEINYEKIYSENVKQISEVLNGIEERQNPHVILPQDPLYSVYSNG